MSEFSTNFVNYLSCFCAFYFCLLKICYNQFSQTSSKNCVLRIRSWSARCDITVELLNKREGLMAVISETLVYFREPAFGLKH